MFTMKYFSEGIKVITYAYAHMIIENLHQQREFWIRFVSGNQRLTIPSEIEINPGWRPSSVLLM